MRGAWRLSYHWPSFIGVGAGDSPSCDYRIVQPRRAHSLQPLEQHAGCAGLRLLHLAGMLLCSLKAGRARRPGAAHLAAASGMTRQLAARYQAAAAAAQSAAEQAAQSMTREPATRPRYLESRPESRCMHTRPVRATSRMPVKGRGRGGSAQFG